MDTQNQVNKTNKLNKLNKLNKVKFEKNSAYKNINSSEYNKPLISKNTVILSSC